MASLSGPIQIIEDDYDDQFLVKEILESWMFPTK